MDTAARSMLIQARKESGLSLRELAQRTGISASQLSQIESGKSEPSVASLFALVSELGLSLDDLIGTPRTNDTDAQARQTPTPAVARTPSVHKRPADYQILQLDSGVVWERLVPQSPEILESLRVTYAPGGRSSSDGSFSRHDGVEFIHMISGTLSVKLGFETTTLIGGDTLFFDAADPHYFINEGTEPAVGLWLILARASSPAERAAEVVPAQPLHIGAH
jgi:transcriptional regulator with XRE-family HTH domain